MWNPWPELWSCSRTQGKTLLSGQVSLVLGVRDDLATFSSSCTQIVSGEKRVSDQAKVRMRQKKLDGWLAWSPCDGAVRSLPEEQEAKVAVTRSSRFQTASRAEDIAAIQLKRATEGNETTTQPAEREGTGDAVEDQQRLGGTRKSRAP